LIEIREVRKTGIIMFVIFSAFFCLATLKSFFGMSIFFCFFILLSLLFLVLPQKMRKVYKIWLLTSHKIGVFLTGVVLVFVYFCFFVPYSLLLKIFGVDFLNNPKGLSTYWKDREDKIFKPEKFKDLF
jgi:hypothetical protein